MYLIKYLTYWVAWRLKLLGTKLFVHKSLFLLTWKKVPKLRITALSEGNPPVIGDLRLQMATNAELVSMSRRHRNMGKINHELTTDQTQQLICATVMIGRICMQTWIDINE